MGTIPASQIDNVNSGVIGVGGTNFAATGLVLSQSTRVPLGAGGAPTVQSFPSGPAVSAFFGATSKESQVANGGTNAGGVTIGTGYFGGFLNATQTPGAILFAQYNQGAVGAYLRGASVAALTLAQLQAVSGALDVTIDGFARNVTSLNLSAATSFSSAASIIATALNGVTLTEGSVTGSIAAGTASVTASIAGELMTVTAIGSGTLVPGAAISGTGVTAGTTVTGQISGTPGGAGLYSVSAAQTVASTTITATYGTMTVTAVGSGTVSVGQGVAGSGVTSGTQVTALGTGTGGDGTYIVNLTQTASSTTLTLSAEPVAVSYDSVSGAFVIASGIVGPASTAAAATGAAATSLNLTAATGAVVSQGAGGATPATFMNALVQANSNWALFMTAFDPDGGSGSLQKQAFAAWKNTQNSRVGYVCWDTDPTPRASVPAASSLGQILAGNGDSGTCLISELSDLNYAAFVLGSAAAINYGQEGGNITFAFKGQPGLVADVTDGTTAINLGGNPQQAGSFGNGYNFYGAYGQGNNNFVWFQRGTVTGPFLWLDNYVNQIWFNQVAQGALLTLQQQSLSIPFNTDGAGMIETALVGTPRNGSNAPSGPISQALDFGMFGPGQLSANEIVAVNAQAGQNVANAISSQGWYLQILPAPPSVRANRGPWQITLWYLYRGSVQSINLNSIALQ